MYNLFLDDIRIPRDAFNYTGFVPFNTEEWVIVRSYDEFVNYITENGMPKFIAFDHDLADEHYSPSMIDPEKYNKYYTEKFTEKTGYDCAKWLIDYCIDNDEKMKPFIVHSMNPAGRENIIAILDNFIKFQMQDE